jgi:rhodanese-related sulfurtransferase
VSGVKKCSAVIGALATLFTMTGCSAAASSQQTDRTTLEVGTAMIIDVRTPEEFAAGHLDGAVLIDIKDASFDSKIAELDTEAEYVIYCRSGNRSAQAVERMRAAGFANLTDLGSLENASEVSGIGVVGG